MISKGPFSSDILGFLAKTIFLFGIHCWEGTEPHQAQHPALVTQSLN